MLEEAAILEEVAMMGLRVSESALCPVNLKCLSLPSQSTGPGGWGKVGKAGVISFLPISLLM